MVSEDAKELSKNLFSAADSCSLVVDEADCAKTGGKIRKLIMEADVLPLPED